MCMFERFNQFIKWFLNNSHKVLLEKLKLVVKLKSVSIVKKW